MEEKQEKDPGYRPAPHHRKTLSGTIIDFSPPIATTTSTELQACKGSTPSESGSIKELELSDIKRAVSKRVKKLIKKVSGEQRIIVLGNPSSGKTTVGNAILGKKLLSVQPAEPASDRNVTDSFIKKTQKMFGKSITVVDTQGLNDSEPVDDSRNFGLAAAWLTACFPGPHVFVLVVNLFAYHKMVCQDADQVHWLAEKGVRDDGGTPDVDEQQYTWQRTAERALDSDVEQGRTENTVHSREQDKNRKSEFLSIQKYFGNEALKYTILVFTHGDKLNPMVLDNMLKEDPHLKSLIGTIGGSHPVDCSSSRKANAKKLRQVIDEMLLRNGGQYYTPKRLKVQKQVNIVKLLHLPFPVPQALATLDLSPAGIERLKKQLQKIAMGAATGSIAGAVLGVTLKMSAFVMDQVGPSMIGYVSLLVMPLILGASSDSEDSGFSLSSISGGVISGFFLIMSMLGAAQGSITGGTAAADAQTYKEAAQKGAEAVLEKEKKKFVDSLQDLLQRIRGGGGESPSSEEDVTIRNEGPERGEPSGNRTMNSNAKVKDGPKPQKEETADSEECSSSVSQQQSSSPSNSGIITLKTSASEESEEVNPITVKTIVETKATPQNFDQSSTSESGRQQLSTSLSNSDTTAPKTLTLEKSGEQENNDVNTITVKRIVETKVTPQNFDQFPTSESGRQQLSTSLSNRVTAAPRTSALEKSVKQQENDNANAITVERTKAALQTKEPKSVKTANKGGIKKQRSITQV